MLTVHDRTATDFAATGLGVLDPHVVEAQMVEELGGQYSLSLVYPADGPLAEHLTLEAIIAAPVPGMSERQGFRIHEVTTTLDGLLEITAFHVFYDLAANFIADTYIVNKTAKAALEQMLGAAATPHSFTATSSDTATRASARIVRMPLAAALMDTGEDNSFASRWGGEITRDNWHIHHATRRGADRGVVIRDRKNLTGYESVIDLTSVVTRIVPVGYDGITLPELYVDSPKLNSFITPHIRVMRYPHIKAIKDAERPREDEVPLTQAHALLRKAAQVEFAKNHVDEPAASYKVSFIELASTREYADFAQLETVLLGDTVTVRHTDLGVALKARVVAYEYDPLQQSYLTVELGSVAARFTSITKTIDSAVMAAETARDLAGIALASADGKTTNHYGPTQPNSARLGDTWFKTNGETTEIWVYQITDTGQPGWVALATDLNHAQVTAELAAAKLAVEEAQGKANAAKAAADAVSARMSTAEVELTHTAQAVSALGTRLESTTQIAQNTVSELNGLGARLDGVDQKASTAAVEAQTAHNTAVEATALASQATRDAVRAAGIADGKADVLIQTSEPAVELRKASTLWIDTTAGANTPKRWNGTTWIALTDKAALDAAARATTAATAATNAQQRADAAYSLAESKPSEAEVKQVTDQALARVRAEITREITNSANGKNTITLSTGSPTGSGVRAGDVWWRHAGGVIVGQWTWDGGRWLATKLRHEVIASVDVNTLLVSGSARMNQAVVAKIIGDAAYFGTLAANRIVVGDGTNLWPDQQLTCAYTGWDNKPGGRLSRVATGEYYGQYYPHTDIAVKPGEQYRVTFEFSRTDPTQSIGIVHRRHMTGTASWPNSGFVAQAKPGDTAVTSHTITVGEGVDTLRFGLVTDACSTPGVQVEIWNIQVRRLTPAVLIEDGAITTNKIAANTITTKHVQARAVTSDKLTIANGFITTAMIANAAITDAKIANLSAAKITTGTLAAARIAAGSITSDKLTIANGFITTAMIGNAAVTNAKIANLDAAKITTGTLSAARIGARSITADKLAANAIQVGLAGWNQSIRISPYQIAWYNGARLEGTITSWGMRFWYGTRFLGSMGHSHKENDAAVRGIANQLEYTGDYISWSYKQTSTADTFTTMLTLDPKGKFYGQAGIHLGDDLRTNGYKFYTTGSRYVTLQDATLTGKGTYAGWVSANGLAKVVFHTYDLMVVTNGTYYNMTRLFDRVQDLMSRVNTLIQLFNRGWITSISGSGSNIRWQYYSNTGLGTMSTNLS
ncbi:phage tail spike protein [Corynebacterium sp. LK2510]|uniref:phage tail spike protein n=1 Tax=Corynebacterium sp. LK2510 TaxID=3110472 RepID=UPI0034CEA6FB